MLPRAHRLVKKKDFAFLFKQAKSFQTKELVLKVRGGTRTPLRVAVIVSKKSAKKAVTRNRVKRLIRQLLREHMRQLPSGVDIAVITRPGIERVPEEQVLSSARRLLAQAFSL